MSKKANKNNELSKVEYEEVYILGLLEIKEKIPKDYSALLPAQHYRITSSTNSRIYKEPIKKDKLPAIKEFNIKGKYTL